MAVRFLRGIQCMSDISDTFSTKRQHLFIGNYEKKQIHTMSKQHPFHFYNPVQNAVAVSALSQHNKNIISDPFELRTDCSCVLCPLKLCYKLPTRHNLYHKAMDSQELQRTKWQVVYFFSDIWNACPSRDIGGEFQHW